MNLKKVLLLNIIILNLFISGCIGGRELNTLGIAIALGIDKAEEGYSITYQILNTKAIASNKPTNESPYYLYTEEGKDVFELIRRLTTESPRKIYNSHLRIVIIGEELAKEDGILELLDFFYRDHEFRTDFYFVVSKENTARDVLKNITPIEPVSGMEMYNSLKITEENWAPVKSIKIIELINYIASDGINPVLTGVEIVNQKNMSDSLETIKRNDTGKLKVNTLGVFRKDKLLGWLSEDESKGYNYITDNVKDTVGYIELDNNKITFEVLYSKPEVKIIFTNNKPAANVKINLEVNVSTVSGNFDVSREENINELANSINEKISNFCKVSVEKAKDEFKTDIFGFGEEIHKSYPKIWKELKDNWDNEFTKLPVNVTVNTRIKRLGINTKPIYTKGLK